MKNPCLSVVVKRSMNPKREESMRRSKNNSRSWVESGERTIRNYKTDDSNTESYSVHIKCC